MSKFKLLEGLEASDVIIPFNTFEKLAEDTAEKLRIESMTLSETVQYASSKEVYEHTIAKAYRQTREAVKDMGKGKALANKACLQARKLLSIAPQVLTGDSAVIKNLGIQQWNEALHKALRESMLDEAGAPREEAESIAVQYVGGGSMIPVTDGSTAEKVLDLGHQKRRHVVKTATDMYHIIAYEYKGKLYAVIEAPGKKPAVYVKGTGDGEIREPEKKA